MKLRIIFSIIFINLISLAYSQNWAVFNKNYRYNYSLENESYTNVVIFADSIKVQGVDTTYCLNRIATKCDSCWFYYPQPGVADSNYIMINQPQFMQRRIVYSNNQYRLSDTSNYIIPRFLSLGNSWTFNASRGITAQVISATIKNYFGISDSVNTILLSTSDTVIISKQFGILKYPAKFGQQEYYTLRGIENKSSYDTTALYGEKVPNFYDFFKLKAGVIHYYSFVNRYTGISSAQCYAYYYAKKTITSSTNIGGVMYNSFIEDRRGCSGNCMPGMFPGSCAIDENPSLFSSLPVITQTYTGVPTSYQYYWDHFYTSSYNNQFITTSMGGRYVVKFGKTPNNHFYKTYGYSCFSGYLREMKSDYSHCDYLQSSQNSKVYYTTGLDNFSFGKIGETFIEGYGQVNKFMGVFEVDNYYCTSTIIDGTDTLGKIIPYGITTGLSNHTENKSSSFGPNPTQDIITINFPFESTGNNGTIEVKDVFGKTVLQKSIVSGASSEKINLQNLAQGIYFVDLKIPHFQKQYKVVKE